MTQRELISFSLTFPDAYQDMPFRDKTSIAIRHKSNKRIFALFLSFHDQKAVNLKCDPMQADFYRSIYKQVVPGWHMNKTHWNTVLFENGLEKTVLEEMIRLSYQLTR